MNDFKGRQFVVPISFVNSIHAIQANGGLYGGNIQVKTDNPMTNYGTFENKDTVQNGQFSLTPVN